MSSEGDEFGSRNFGDELRECEDEFQDELQDELQKSFLKNVFEDKFEDEFEDEFECRNEFSGDFEMIHPKSTVDPMSTRLFRVPFGRRSVSTQLHSNCPKTEIDFLEVYWKHFRVIGKLLSQNERELDENSVRTIS